MMEVQSLILTMKLMMRGDEGYDSEPLEYTSDLEDNSDESDGDEYMLDVKQRDGGDIDGNEDDDDRLYKYFVDNLFNSVSFTKESIYPAEYSDSGEDAADMQGGEHIAAPDCASTAGYNGHSISAHEMQGCYTFQCLAPKTPSQPSSSWSSGPWQPQQNDDQDFESAPSAKYFLTGLADCLPSRDMGRPTVYPVRHGCEEPHAENFVWNWDIINNSEIVGFMALPFHPTCLEVYKRASLRRFGKVDIQALTEWWQSECTYADFNDKFPRDRAVLQGSSQWWHHQPGDGGSWPIHALSLVYIQSSRLQRNTGHPQSSPPSMKA